jgi:hypothetical protein
MPKGRAISVTLSSPSAAKRRTMARREPSAMQSKENLNEP